MGSTQEWVEVKTIIGVERKRITKEKESSEVLLYLSSLDKDLKHPRHAVRSSLDIEIYLHSALMCSFVKKYVARIAAL